MQATETLFDLCVNLIDAAIVTRFSFDCLTQHAVTARKSQLRHKLKVILLYRICADGLSGRCRHQQYGLHALPFGSGSRCFTDENSLENSMVLAYYIGIDIKNITLINPTNISSLT